MPDESCREEVLSFYREIEESGGECIGFADHGNYARYYVVVYGAFIVNVNIKKVCAPILVVCNLFC